MNCDFGDRGSLNTVRFAMKTNFEIEFWVLFFFWRWKETFFDFFVFYGRYLFRHFRNCGCLVIGFVEEFSEGFGVCGEVRPEMLTKKRREMFSVSNAKRKKRKILVFFFRLTIFTKITWGFCVGKLRIISGLLGNLNNIFTLWFFVLQKKFFLTFFDVVKKIYNEKKREKNLKKMR